MHIFIHSCHASLEYDETKMLRILGHKVTGHFDIGSNQRPKIEGVTDQSLSDAQRAFVDEVGYFRAEDIGSPDAILLHQLHKFPQSLAAYAEQGIPVILRVFGQGSLEDHIATAALARKHSNVFIVPYAMKETAIYRAQCVPDNQLAMIRFAKTRDEFDPENWTDQDPACFVPCNNIQTRGASCGWNIVEYLLRKSIPVRFAGRDTDLIGGLGELTYQEYKEQLQRASVYLSVGTIPAPYTLTFVEAACSGTPIIALNNRHGIAQEGFGVPLGNDEHEIASLVETALKSPKRRRSMHQHSRHLADTVFNGRTTYDQWAVLLDRIWQYAKARKQ